MNFRVEMSLAVMGYVYGILTVYWKLQHEYVKVGKRFIHIVQPHTVILYFPTPCVRLSLQWPLTDRCSYFLTSIRPVSLVATLKVQNYYLYNFAVVMPSMWRVILHSLDSAFPIQSVNCETLLSWFSIVWRACTACFSNQYFASYKP